MFCVANSNRFKFANWSNKFGLTCNTRLIMTLLFRFCSANMHIGCGFIISSNMFVFNYALFWNLTNKSVPWFEIKTRPACTHPPCCIAMYLTTIFVYNTHKNAGIQLFFICHPRHRIRWHLLFDTPFIIIDSPRTPTEHINQTVR